MHNPLSAAAWRVSGVFSSRPGIDSLGCENETVCGTNNQRAETKRGQRRNNTSAATRPSHSGLQESSPASIPKHGPLGNTRPAGVTPETCGGRSALWDWVHGVSQPDQRVSWMKRHRACERREGKSRPFCFTSGFLT